MSKVLVLFGICLSAAALSEVEGAKAEGLGVGVSSAKIEIQEAREWPQEVPIFITNFSAEEEHFEVLFEKDGDLETHAVPGRFLLEAGASRRVLFTFEEPRRKGKGLIKIVSKKTSADGLSTGIGVKVPFYLSNVSESDDTKFLARVRDSAWPRLPIWLFGSGMIFTTLSVLWYISDMVRTWMLNSSRH